MSIELDQTHDPALQSWVGSANDPATDFPIQNLPFGRFRRPESAEWQIGVAIGDQILDLKRAGLIDSPDMARLMAMDPVQRRVLRRRISEALSKANPDSARLADAVVPMVEAELGLPCEIGDYTDFYVGIHHATAIGKLFRPDNPLLPNYKWVPIGYHGRASTINVSGTDFPRPKGQRRGADDEQPVFGPSTRMDLELEVGVFIGRGNKQGDAIPMASAEDHVFGIGLFNDWSARDLQAWEYQPLGPFLSKNFASTVSPWIVTMDALAPFRRGFSRPAGDPDPLPYLDSVSNREHGAIDMGLEVWLQTNRMREEACEGELLARSNFADAAYWTVAQIVAHHAVNGCSLRTGDLLGSGTLSGPLAGQEGSLIEKTFGGKQPVVLGNGEQRTFLEDGDRITLRGRCEREGVRSIGFGVCSATLLPAR